MKLGVVCEGPTDFEFIKHFLPEALRNRGVDDVEVIPLQPPVDNTRGGGSTEVIHWLMNNTPEFRNSAFLSSGLFSIPDKKSQCDGIVVQLDSDVLKDESFISFIVDKGGAVNVDDLQTVENKAEEVENLLKYFALDADMTEKERKQHVYVAAVDATEAWCIAAYKKIPYNPEELEGEGLATEFGKVLNHSEGNDVMDRYSAVDKSVDRRSDFCNRHCRSVFVEKQSAQFRKMIENVYGLLA